MSGGERDVLNFVYLVLFVGAVLVSAVTITIRLVIHLRAGRPVPRLMPRDLALMAGLVIPFGGILAARAFGFGELLAGNLLWTAVTGGAAVLGALVFAFYEVFVIGTGGTRR